MFIVVSIIITMYLPCQSMSRIIESSAVQFLVIHCYISQSIDNMYTKSYNNICYNSTQSSIMLIV